VRPRQPMAEVAIARQPGPADPVRAEESLTEQDSRARAAGSARRARKGGLPFHHILVPIDGVDEHEEGLGPAAQLALQLKIPMLLFTAVPPADALKGQDSATAALLPRATEEVLRLAEQESARHLTVHVRELQEMGVSVSGRVMRADPAEGVLATAREMHSDLIVLGTHALSATQAFWSASMTPKSCTRPAPPSCSPRAKATRFYRRYRAAIAQGNEANQRSLRAM